MNTDIWHVEEIHGCATRIVDENSLRVADSVAADVATIVHEHNTYGALLAALERILTLHQLTHVHACARDALTKVQS
jgi:hypothetical protein